MKHLEEKTIASRTLFEGRVVRLQVDEVLLPNGNTSTREIIKHPGAVCVMAVTEEGKLILVRQYRKAMDKVTLEIPAGKLNPGEDPAACALRELEEETGLVAEGLDPVIAFYTAPGFTDERIHFFRARGLKRGTFRPDEDEFVERVELTLEECREKIKSGEICDAKTVMAVWLREMEEAGLR
ncbi:NUDIX domain-containing protein [Staphylospora marina]|uniref:NUDIX domain-containing protein n=1 Tax=Staphylospora marina TaxID=2490858 RepID=UPI000F5BC501|nr:NUDIX hydrolase [Staphylospora marina]